MGDRGNIVIKEDNAKGEVWLYSHWTGSVLPTVLREALKRGRDRWTDSPYLARIIFCEMLGDDPRGLTGFGITTYQTDNEHPIVFVDTEKQRVERGERSWTFEEYAGLSDAQLEEIEST